MSTFFLNIVLLLFTLYFYKKIRNGMHIMQLGHYYNEPYIQWLKDTLQTDRIYIINYSNNVFIY